MAKIELVKGDITIMQVDAIVNAANSGLRGGGGVDGAIHAAGGTTIMEECRAIIRERGVVPAGHAVITNAGDLPSRYVIHAVGPVFDSNAQSKMQQLLASCYTNSLQLAIDYGCRSIAFPNISTGVYGYPKEMAARVAIGAVDAFTDAQDVLRKICYVCFDSENYQIYAGLLT